MRAAFVVAIVAFIMLAAVLLGVLMSELKRAIARKTAIQDAALDAIVSIDVAGRVIEYNPAAVALFGISADRALGCDALELFVPPRDRERARAALVEHAASDAGAWRDRRIRYSLLRANGEEFAAEIAIMRVQAHDETLLTGFVRDISIEVNAEAERRHSREMLEMQVSERTADLIHANEQVRQSLREKEVLLGEIHHRVKNNLQVISSLLHLQVERLPNAAARQALAESQSRIQSMALVHQLLYRSKDFSHIEFLDYLQTMVDSLVRSYQTDAINVEATVRGDRLQLDIDRAITCGLIVTELVTNALRHAFTDRTLGRLAITLAARGHDVVLEVRDDGSGIPVTALEGTSTFGLQIARTLTRQLAGDIDIGLDDGTVVQIRFPLSMRAAA